MGTGPVLLVIGLVKRVDCYLASFDLLAPNSLVKLLSKVSSERNIPIHHSSMVSRACLLTNIVLHLVIWPLGKVFPSKVEVEQ